MPLVPSTVSAPPQDHQRFKTREKERKGKRRPDLRALPRDLYLTIGLGDSGREKKTMPIDFDKQSYWHERFSSEEAFEWLVSSTDFVSILEPYLRELDASTKILQLGFGTSDLQNHLRQRGFLDVTNIDYEPLAVTRGINLEEKAFGDVKMKYAVADATQLDLGEQFDLVIDKSAVDAVSCAGDAALLRMARGIRKSLGRGGTWISLSLSLIHI